MQSNMCQEINTEDGRRADHKKVKEGEVLTKEMLKVRATGQRQDTLPPGWVLEYAICVTEERRMLITPTMQNHACTPECENVVSRIRIGSAGEGRWAWQRSVAQKKRAVRSQRKLRLGEMCCWVVRRMEIPT